MACCWHAEVAQVAPVAGTERARARVQGDDWRRGRQKPSQSGDLDVYSLSGQQFEMTL